MMEAVLVIAAILQNFKFVLADGQVIEPCPAILLRPSSAIISSSPPPASPPPPRPPPPAPPPPAPPRPPPPAAPAPGKAVGPTGRRRTSAPLVEIARAATQQEAMDGLERWRARHQDVWPLLEPNDILVDSMRGRNTTWTRIRVNLRHVPESDRPGQESLEVDYDPWHG